MPFDFKVGLLPNGDQLSSGMQISTSTTRWHFRQVRWWWCSSPQARKVWLPSENSIRFNRPHVNQHLDRPEDRRPPQARFHPLEIVPEFLHAEILPAGSQFGQPGGDAIPCLRSPPALFFEGRPDFFRYAYRTVFTTHNTHYTARRPTTACRSRQAQPGLGVSEYTSRLGWEGSL